MEKLGLLAKIREIEKEIYVLRILYGLDEGDLLLAVNQSKISAADRDFEQEQRHG